MIRTIRKFGGSGGTRTHIKTRLEDEGLIQLDYGTKLKVIEKYLTTLTSFSQPKNKERLKMTITKEKGDLGAIKAIADLSTKGYKIFVPVVTEHLPFDFVAYKNDKFYKIQAKYTTLDIASKSTSWTDKNGSHQKDYKEGDFDYYALYYPHLDVVLYPSIKFAGCRIASECPNSATPFYWWEDFIDDLTDHAEKKTYKDFGYDVTKSAKFLESARKDKFEYRKVPRPSKEELHKMLWEKPTLQIAKELGVSDKAITKWAKRYGIEKPPRGYWAKLRANKDTNTNLVSQDSSF